MFRTLTTMLLAATALLPAAASAQDQDRSEAYRKWHDQHAGAKPPHQQQQQQRPAVQVPQPNQRPQMVVVRPPQLQPQQQPQQGNRPEGGNRGGWHGGQGQQGGQGQPGGAPAVAVQQDRGRPDWRGNGNGAPPRQAWNGQPQRQPDGRADNRGGYPGQQGRPGWNGNDGRGPDGRGPAPQHWQGIRAGWQNGYADNRGGYGDRGGWTRDWRANQRYDWNRYRSANRSAYRLPRYYAPYGWSYGYRRYSVGVRLNQLLWAQDYWIDDPWTYHLPPADGPYRWVRYYNDALLVDIRYGEVVDVVHDIFW